MATFDAAVWMEYTFTYAARIVGLGDGMRAGQHLSLVLYMMKVERGTLPDNISYYLLANKSGLTRVDFVR